MSAFRPDQTPLQVSSLSDNTVNAAGVTESAVHPSSLALWHPVPRTIQYNGANRMLSALPRDDFETYFSHLEPVDLNLKQVVHEPGAPVREVYFLEGAVASVLTLMADGSTTEVGMIGAEGMIGMAGVLGDEIVDQLVIASIPGPAWRLSLEACVAAFEGSPAVRRVFLGFAASLLGLSAQTAACNRLHSIEQRCARWLLMAADRWRSDTMPITHEFLASLLGVRRAGITTLTGELQRLGLISYRQRSLTIRDHHGLETVACECYRRDRERLNRWFGRSVAESRQGNL